MLLRVGQPVPDHSVQAHVRGERAPSEFALSNHRGRWVVLFFYPRDFTFICPTELAAFAERHDDFVDCSRTGRPTARPSSSIRAASSCT